MNVNEILFSMEGCDCSCRCCTNRRKLIKAMRRALSEFDCNVTRTAIKRHHDKVKRDIAKILT
jgi:hypothetical protein